MPPTRPEQGAILLEIRRVERRVIGKRPGDKAIDHLGRRGKQVLIERLEIAISIGPLAELSPDVGARGPPTGMQEDGLVGLGFGLDRRDSVQTLIAP
ncbi:MAG: hypothetical protein WBW85_25215 [Terriglobales bacterium]